jgi:hypothetical protein
MPFSLEVDLYAQLPSKDVIKVQQQAIGKCHLNVQMIRKPE